MSGAAKGKKGLYVELPEAEVAAFRAFCSRRRAKLGEEVRRAIIRHMANPPVMPEDQPLPPPESKPARRKPRGK